MKKEKHPQIIRDWDLNRQNYIDYKFYKEIYKGCYCYRYYYENIPGYKNYFNKFLEKGTWFYKQWEEYLKTGKQPKYSCYEFFMTEEEAKKREM